jgi:hypothetical protein
MKHHKGSTQESQRARPHYTDSPRLRHDDAEYWQSRAERTRNQSRRYKQSAVRDHFAKIAAGYDELASRAGETAIETEKDPQTSSGQCGVAETPEECGSRSDQERVRDALEDDEVREALRASRKHSRDANAV